MHVRSFAVDAVVDEDVSGGSDGKFTSGSFETVREHSIFALQMNKTKVREGLFLRAKNHTPFNPYASVCPITLDHIDSTSSLSTAVTLMTVIPNEAFSSTAPV